jgi:hypothetical protein
VTSFGQRISDTVFLEPAAVVKATAPLHPALELEHGAVLQVQGQEPPEDGARADVEPIVEVLNGEQVDDGSELKLDRNGMELVLVGPGAEISLVRSNAKSGLESAVVVEQIDLWALFHPHRVDFVILVALLVVVVIVVVVLVIFVAIHGGQPVSSPSQLVGAVEQPLLAIFESLVVCVEDGERDFGAHQR